MIGAGLVNFLFLFDVDGVFDDFRRRPNAVIGNSAEQHVAASGHEIFELV